MSNVRNAEELCNMMNNGQMNEAFEKFYAEEVTVIEANGEVRNGKNAQREAINQWQNMIQEVHEAGNGSVTANAEGDTTMVESWIEASFKDGNRFKMEEVAVQNWKNGKIVKERFYYNVPPGMEGN